ncbi:hypothetical protein ACFUJR_30675 [Streptomyces sp. NPDC057271]|uniref:hypothetical protein n=1 Tax=unclassified Streptomyces TaxID=2593676 RepID=UPI00363D8AEE
MDRRFRAVRRQIALHHTDLEGSVNLTHTAMLALSIALGVILSLLAAGAAFAVARWGGSPVPACVAASGKAFATSLMVFSAVLAVVVTFAT